MRRPREEPVRLTYPLPKDTRAVVEHALPDCRNLGLRFDRFIGFRVRGGEWELRGEDKKRVLAGLVEAAEAARKDRRYRELVRSYYLRWRETVRAAGAADEFIFEGVLEWRMVVRLGRDSVLETGFAFHRVYGFPYIPGSALKGMTRCYALWQIARELCIPSAAGRLPASGKTPLEELEAILAGAEGEERWRAGLERLGKNCLLPADSPLVTGKVERVWDSFAVQCRAFRGLFGVPGDTGSRGRVVFFDAVPVEPPVLKVDVMNPHYGEYYRSGDVPPADYLSPVPVYFLTVDAGSRFAFAVGGADEKDCRQAVSWLRGALREFGVGGKTSAGYGYFITAGDAGSDAT